jgi:hypothetical protein
MATIQINGVDLAPQPAEATWETEIIKSDQGGGLLNGTEAVGAYKIFRVRAPVLAGQSFNWDSYDNQVLTSLQAFAPGELPTSANVVYSSGVVSRKITTYRSPVERTITGIEMEILVVV